MKENTTNISDFLEYERLCTFTKKRSPKTIAIYLTDKNDDWFYYVITYRTKSGKISSRSMITKSDIPVWKNYIQNSLGYTLID